MGFLPTLDAKLVHPPAARPGVLYLHAATFTAWVMLFIAQIQLVRTRRVVWHRRLGLFGNALGALIPVLGLLTALTITRLQLSAGDPDAEQSLIVPVFDMAAFALLFSAAIGCRRRRDYHSRFMLMASSGLTVAAFARFPSWLIPENTFYVAVDLIIAIAILHDWIATRRVHRVYCYALPILIAGQATTMWITIMGTTAWRAVAHRLLM